MLAVRRADADAERERAEARIRAIEAKLHILERSLDMSHTYDVVRTTSPAVRLASVARTVDPDEGTSGLFTAFGELFAELAALLDDAGVEPCGPAWSLYDRSDDNGIVIHAALPIDSGAVVPTGRLVVIDRPETDVASTIHVGDVAEMAAAYAAIMSWVEAQALRASGGSTEVSLEWDPEHPDRNVTELLVAIQDS